MIRTHGAGTLTGADTGDDVVLDGWVARRRDHGEVVFLDVRDASGLVQVVAREPDAAAAAHAVRAEYCVRVRGAVRARPEGTANPDLATGQVEVDAASLEVLAACAPLPFPVTPDPGAPEPSEEARLAHRYLDLRRELPSAALRLRSRVNAVLRRVLDDAAFVEVETPTLTRSTPEGARDFLVPVRLQPGTWYALPQSPQLFKQLLMVAGLERYFQIARCYRDEDLRADRQPEFTQLDVEMSFVQVDDVLALTEELLAAVWAETLDVELPRPFPRLSWQEATSRFGSDKPDLRYGLELVDLTSYFSATSFRVFAGVGHVGALVAPGGASWTRRELDAWQEWARGRGARGLAYVLIDADGTPRESGPVVKNLSPQERDGLAAATGAGPGDAVLFAAGTRGAALELLGAARLRVVELLGLEPEEPWRFCWVTDFPLVERTEEGGWTAVHHPFTRPTDETSDLLATDPAAVLAAAYDVTVNGVELGGGSLRVHEQELQQQVFAVLGLDAAAASAQFGFLLEAFRYGAPPHGGIAFGLDRMVALLAGASSIRDVIAFPKTASGSDPLTGAPTPISAAQRREAGVDATPPGPRDAPTPPRDLTAATSPTPG